MSDTALVAPPIHLFGLPKRAVHIVIIEYLDRFSFYGMLAIFAPFLIAPVSEAPDGGLTADFLDPDGHTLSYHQPAGLPARLS